MFFNQRYKARHAFEVMYPLKTSLFLENEKNDRNPPASSLFSFSVFMWIFLLKKWTKKENIFFLRFITVGHLNKDLFHTVPLQTTSYFCEEKKNLVKCSFIALLVHTFFVFFDSYKPLIISFKLLQAVTLAKSSRCQRYSSPPDFENLVGQYHMYHRCFWDAGPCRDELHD